MLYWTGLYKLYSQKHSKSKFTFHKSIIKYLDVKNLYATLNNQKYAHT